MSCFVYEASCLIHQEYIRLCNKVSSNFVKLQVCVYTHVNTTNVPVQRMRTLVPQRSFNEVFPSHSIQVKEVVAAIEGFIFSSEQKIVMYSFNSLSECIT